MEDGEKTPKLEAIRTRTWNHRTDISRTLTGGLTVAPQTHTHILWSPEGIVG